MELVLSKGTLIPDGGFYETEAIGGATGSLFLFSAGKLVTSISSMDSQSSSD